MPLERQIHQAKGVGVLVCDHARGLIEDNDICANARAGVAILSGGNPTVRLNKIHDGKDSGVLISEKVTTRHMLPRLSPSPRPSSAPPTANS